MQQNDINFVHPMRWILLHLSVKLSESKSIKNNINNCRSHCARETVELLRETQRYFIKSVACQQFRPHAGKLHDFRSPAGACLSETMEDIGLAKRLIQT